MLKIAKNHGFLHLDHADPRRGSREHVKNRSKKTWVFAPRPCRSPQRVARAPQKSQKTMGFCTSTTPIPAEGRASMLKIAAKKHGFLHLDHADPRRGLREHRRNRKKHLEFFAPRPRRFPQKVARAPQKSQKTTRVFAPRPRRSPQRVARAPQKSQKKPWVFAPRPRRSPQRVARAPQKSQKTMGFCTSTTPIPAEGRASMLKIAAKKHGFLHLDHADPRRGLREHRRNRKKHLEFFAPRPRRSPQRVARAC